MSLQAVSEREKDLINDLGAILIGWAKEQNLTQVELTGIVDCAMISLWLVNGMGLKVGKNDDGPPNGI